MYITLFMLFVVIFSSRPWTKDSGIYTTLSNMYMFSNQKSQNYSSSFIIMSNQPFMWAKIVKTKKCQNIFLLFNSPMIQTLRMSRSVCGWKLPTPVLKTDVTSDFSVTAITTLALLHISSSAVGSTTQWSPICRSYHISIWFIFQLTSTGL